MKKISSQTVGGRLVTQKTMGLRRQYSRASPPGTGLPDSGTAGGAAVVWRRPPPWCYAAWMRVQVSSIRRMWSGPR